jgi:hypothetical protein
MTSNDQIIADLNENTDILLEELAGFNHENFKQRPSPNEWSASEVTEHLLLIERNVKKALLGKANVTERAYDGKLTVLKPALAATGNKIQAPEMVVPQSGTLNRQEMEKELRVLREEEAALIATLDMSETCLEFKHPMMGTMTRYEWVYFSIYHTERHLHQLRRIAAVINKEA